MDYHKITLKGPFINESLSTPPTDNTVARMYYNTSTPILHAGDDTDGVIWYRNNGIWTFLLDSTMALDATTLEGNAAAAFATADHLHDSGADAYFKIGNNFSEIAADPSTALENLGIKTQVDRLTEWYVLDESATGGTMALAKFGKFIIESDTIPGGAVSLPPWGVVPTVNSDYVEIGDYVQIAPGNDWESTYLYLLVYSEDGVSNGKFMGVDLGYNPGQVVIDVNFSMRLVYTGPDFGWTFS